MKVRKTTLPEVKHLIVPFEVKEVNFEERTFEGYASAYNLDLGDDIVEPGAFARTIEQRVSKGTVKFLDQHNAWGTTAHLVGKVLEAREDSYGLWVKVYVSAVEEGDKILTKIKEGVLDALSIGYDTVRQEFEELGDRVIRRLKEIRLWEVSVVIFPMNPNAVISAGSVKSACSVADIKLCAIDTEWDAEAALTRVTEWAGEDPGKLSKAFLFVDENGEREHLVADIVEGELQAVPKAVMASAVVVQSAKGETPEAKALAIRSQLDKLFERMDKTPPWKGLTFLAESFKAITGTDIDGFNLDDFKEKASGRMLSEADRELIEASIEAYKALLDASEPPETALSKLEGLATPEAVSVLSSRVALLKLQAPATSVEAGTA